MSVFLPVVGTKWDCSVSETVRDLVGGVLTCMPDALVLGSLPVASPWCLQFQSWNITKKKRMWIFHWGVQEILLIHFWTNVTQFIQFDIYNPDHYYCIYQCRAFSLLGHPPWWREFSGNGWRFLTCRKQTKKFLMVHVMLSCLLPLCTLPPTIHYLPSLYSSAL